MKKYLCPVLLFFACAFAVASDACAALRLVCEIDGRIFAPKSISENSIEVSDGTETRQVEIEGVNANAAVWLLKGNLRNNASFLAFSPIYTISRKSPGGEDFGDDLLMRARVEISHQRTRAPFGGEMLRGDFLKLWPYGISASRALLVAVWMVDGRATEVRVRVIPPTPDRNFVRHAAFNLTREQASAGQAVLLLWIDGGFVAPNRGMFEGLDADAVTAVMFDDATRLQALLAKNTKATLATKDGGLTLLHLASESGSLRAMDVLLKASRKLVRTEAKDSLNRITPLEMAIGKCRTGAVERLLRAKAAVNLVPMKRGVANTPFTAAVSTRDPVMVRLMLDAGANPFDPKTADYSAFDIAVINGDIDIAELLFGKKPLPPDFFAGYKESDMLRYQLREGRDNMVRWLLEHGVPINDNRQTLRALLETARAKDDPTFVNLIAMAVKPPASVASPVAAPAVMVSSITHDYPLRKPSGLSKTRDASALSEAARADWPQLVRKLIDIGFSANEADENGATALHEAAAANATGAMRTLLEHDALIDATDSGGASALDWALDNDADEAARLLVEKGARLNPAYKSATKSFESALRLDIPELVVPMIEAGILPDGKLHGVWTPRQTAAIYQARACMATLGAVKSGDIPEYKLAASREFSMTAEKNETDDPRDPILPRPEVSVALKALVDATGRIRFCMAEPGADGMPSPLALRNAARHALEKQNFQSTTPDTVGEAYWISGRCRFPAVSDVADTFTGNVDEAFSVIEPRALAESPPAAKAKKIPGFVIATFVINKNGRVESADILKATPGFGSAALAAVSQWRFRPAKKDGVPVKMRTVIPLIFPAE